MVTPPPTAEGYYILHDVRAIRWDRWRDAAEDVRSDAVRSGIEHLQAQVEAAETDVGSSGVYAVPGDAGDLLIIHIRPTLEALSQAERRFEQIRFADFTERTDAYVSVAEVSGYTAPEYFEDPESVDPGLRRYMDAKLHPEIPEAAYVSFYPMSKRRAGADNWYDLPLEERAELMADHAAIGKEYAGRITQMIASSVGFEEYEWSVTLFADEPTAIKDIVYEMRFDAASARYGEFERFVLGVAIAPTDLPALLAGEPVPAETEAADASPPMREALADLNIYAGSPHGEDVYATVAYLEDGPEPVFASVEPLRANFDHYGTHRKTAVYATTDASRTAVVSIWETQSAAETAAGFIDGLDGVVGKPEEPDGFGTMGMFYTVETDFRDEFRDTFAEVGELLETMDGHQETDLLINHEDPDDMFIASQWDDREAAMGFFRSDAFRETVRWGREVLTDRPRHVFLT